MDLRWSRHNGMNTNSSAAMHSASHITAHQHTFHFPFVCYCFSPVPPALITIMVSSSSWALCDVLQSVPHEYIWHSLSFTLSDRVYGKYKMPLDTDGTDEAVSHLWSIVKLWACACLCVHEVWKQANPFKITNNHIDVCTFCAVVCTCSFCNT